MSRSSWCRSSPEWTSSCPSSRSAAPRSCGRGARDDRRHRSRAGRRRTAKRAARRGRCRDRGRRVGGHRDRRARLRRRQQLRVGQAVRRGVAHRDGSRGVRGEGRVRGGGADRHGAGGARVGHRRDGSGQERAVERGQAPEREERGGGDPPSRLQATDHPAGSSSCARLVRRVGTHVRHRSSGVRRPWRKPDFWGDVTPQCRDSTSSATVLRPTPWMRGVTHPRWRLTASALIDDARHRRRQFQRGEPDRCSTTISARAPTLVVPTTSVLSGTDASGSAAPRSRGGLSRRSSSSPASARRWAPPRSPSRSPFRSPTPRTPPSTTTAARPRPARPAAHGRPVSPSAVLPVLPHATIGPAPSPTATETAAPQRRRRARAPSPRSRRPSCARPSSPRTPPTRAPSSPSGPRSPRSGCPTSGAATGPPTATPASTARA